MPIKLFMTLLLLLICSCSTFADREIASSKNNRSTIHLGYAERLDISGEVIDELMVLPDSNTAHLLDICLLSS